MSSAVPIAEDLDELRMALIAGSAIASDNLAQQQVIRLTTFFHWQNYPTPWEHVSSAIAILSQLVNEELISTDVAQAALEQQIDMLERLRDEEGGTNYENTEADQ